MTATTAAYSASAAAWARGPMRIYGRLAVELVARSPVTLASRRVLDLGAGTGAASHAAAGAHVVAVDRAAGMLQVDRAARPPAAVGDAEALPFPDRAFDVVIAAFSLNHLDDPAAGAREAGRVARECVLASTYAADDDHPVKDAVERALAEAGWQRPPWYDAAKAAMAAWGTVERSTEVVLAAGLEPVTVDHARVPFPDLSGRDLVEWRLGMAQTAAFVAAHDADALADRALALLPADAGPLVRSVLFIVARAR